MPWCSFTLWGIIYLFCLKREKLKWESEKRELARGTNTLGISPLCVFKRQMSGSEVEIKKMTPWSCWSSSDPIVNWVGFPSGVIPAWRCQKSSAERFVVFHHNVDLIRCFLFKPMLNAAEIEDDFWCFDSSFLSQSGYWTKLQLHI